MSLKTTLSFNCHSKFISLYWITIYLKDAIHITSISNFYQSIYMSAKVNKTRNYLTIISTLSEYTVAPFHWPVLFSFPWLSKTKKDTQCLPIHIFFQIYWTITQSFTQSILNIEGMGAFLGDIFWKKRHFVSLHTLKRNHF